MIIVFKHVLIYKNLYDYKRLQTFTNEFKYLITEYYLQAAASLPCRNI